MRDTDALRGWMEKNIVVRDGLTLRSGVAYTRVCVAQLTITVAVYITYGSNIVCLEVLLALQEFARQIRSLLKIQVSYLN